jgi:hypothetical protein
MSTLLPFAGGKRVSAEPDSRVSSPASICPAPIETPAFSAKGDSWRRTPRARSRPSTWMTSTGVLMRTCRQCGGCIGEGAPALEPQSRLRGARQREGHALAEDDRELQELEPVDRAEGEEGVERALSSEEERVAGKTGAPAGDRAAPRDCCRRRRRRPAPPAEPVARSARRSACRARAGSRTRARRRARLAPSRRRRLLVELRPAYNEWGESRASQGMRGDRRVSR